MNYFTPELHLRGQTAGPEEQSEVDHLWEEAVERYERQLQRIRPGLPPHLRSFLDELLLHDAEVLSLARQRDQFLLVVRKSIPPRELMILTYALTAEPVIDTAALPGQDGSRVMQLLYNEFDVVPDGGQTVYGESILFSNGWEVRLRFRDVQVVRADPVYPTADTLLVPVSASVRDQP